MSKTLPNTEKFTCPDWCEGHDVDSIRDAEEGGFLRHMTGVGGDALSELRNAHTGRVVRAHKASYDVFLSKVDDQEIYNHPEWVNVEVTEWRGEHTTEKIELDLTPGEARSLAAGLVAAADRAEIVTTTQRFPRYVRGDLR